MGPVASGFEFEYVPTTIHFGRGCVSDIEEEIRGEGCSTALVVCGSNVGANDAVMEPLESALGSTYEGTFDETSQRKYIGTALAGVERIRNDGVDALVPVGGGSSLDVAKAMSLLGVDDRSPHDLEATVRDTGLVPTPPDGEPPIPLFVVPTTLAGADMTTSGGINLDPDPYRTIDARGEVQSAKSGDPRIMPRALFYDPDLFATTPRSILAASAMNGFDKGIETLYANETNSVSHAHSLHGLTHLSRGLPALTDAKAGDAALDHSIVGCILVQYGCRPNVIHAFGNAISSYYPVQQGAVHGIVAPSVLEYVFDNVPARRSLLADGLGVDTTGSDTALGRRIVETVAGIRDDLGLPSRLQTVDGLRQEDFSTVASLIAENFHLQYSPSDLSLETEDIEQILQDAW